MKPTVVLSLLLLLGIAGCSRQEAVQKPQNFTGTVVTSYDEALTAARSQNKPVLIVVGSPATLQGIERNLLSAPAIASRGNEFVTAKLDPTSPGANQIAAQQDPTVIVTRADGTEVWRGAGMVMPGQILTALDQAKGGAVANQ